MAAWNDARIVALNPSATLPASNITRVLLQPPSPYTLAVTRALTELAPQAWPHGAVASWPFNASATIAYVPVRSRGCNSKLIRSLLQTLSATEAELQFRGPSLALLPMPFVVDSEVVRVTLFADGMRFLTYA